MRDIEANTMLKSLSLKYRQNSRNRASLTTIDVKPRASKREIATSSDRSKVLLMR